MTVLISDDYDSYSTGSIASLNGGTGWSGAYGASSTARIDSSVSVSSPNSAWVFNNEFFNRSLSLSGFFTWSFYVYVGSIGTNIQIGLDNNPINPYEISWTINSSGATAKWVNGTALSNQPISSASWHLLEMEVDTSTHEIRARIDGNTWSAWTFGTDYISSSFNRLLVTGSSTNVFLDNMEFTDSPLPAPNDLLQIIII